MSNAYSPPPIPGTPDDNSHLNALAVAHYVIGGLGILFACIPLIHVTMGIMIMTGGFGHNSGEPPALFGLMFVLIGGLFFLLGQAIAICVIKSGSFLKQRRNYMFSFVIGCILCTAFPVGTVLGIFTIVVLSRDSVKRLYGRTF